LRNVIRSSACDDAALAMGDLHMRSVHWLGAFALTFVGALISIAPPAGANGPAPYGYRAPSGTHWVAPDPGQVFYDWSGFYAGGHLGGGWAIADWTVPTESVEHSAAGFAGGVHLGAQKQWTNLVAGIEVAYRWTGMEESSASLLAPAIRLTSEVSNLLLVTGRLGFAHENWLAFAKGGYASGEIDFRVSGGGPSFSDREHGWVAGVGIEYAFSPNLIAGVEYDFVHLNADGRDDIRDVGVDVQSVLARLTYKFGPRHQPPPAPVK
jgi:outer membrane immunogenic protein